MVDIFFVNATLDLHFEEAPKCLLEISNINRRKTTSQCEQGVCIRTTKPGLSDDLKDIILEISHFCQSV